MLCTAVVEVGQSEAVTVLVADGAEATIVLVACQFVDAAIGVDHQTVACRGGRYFYGLVVIVGHPALIRPDGIIVASVVHTLAGIDDEQLVNITVGVPVVWRPVGDNTVEGCQHVLHEYGTSRVGC